MRNTATAGRGAIYNSQMLVINDSTFDANLISVLKKSGAIDQPTFGGGIFSTGFLIVFSFPTCNCVGGAIYSEPQDAHSTKNGTLSITGTTLMSNQGAQYLMQLFSFPCLSLLKTVFRPLSIIVWTRTRMMLIRAAFVNPITNAWQFMEMEAPSHF